MILSTNTMTPWDLPGSPVIRLSYLHCRDTGSISGQGIKIPHTQQLSQKVKTDENPTDRETWRAIVHGVTKPDMTERLTEYSI